MSAPTDLAIRDMVQLRIIERQYPQARNYWDENWLRIEGRLSDASSEARFAGPYLRTDDLAKLDRGLVDCLSEKADLVELSPMEPVFALTIRRVDRIGHFELRARCTVPDVGPARTSEHTYFLQIDQTDVRMFQSSVARALREYPVIGKP